MAASSNARRRFSRDSAAHNPRPIGEREFFFAL
jgi:hypothetical protein